MITYALEFAAFMAIIAWPLTLPALLLLLIGLIFLVIYCVKNRRNKKMWMGAGAVAVGVLLLVSLLVSAVKRESQPYSESAALRLYQSHQAAYDRVAAFMLEQAEADGGQSLIISYYLSGKWPEEIKREMNEVLNNWSLRCGNPRVSVRIPGSPSKDLPVLFEIYTGPEYIMGGETAYDVQYLVYILDSDNPKLYGETLVHLTGDWYLYTETNW